MGRHKSTISRELKRNESPPGQYWPDTANTKALKRRKRGSILDRDPKLRAFVNQQLTHHFWTPDQISGHLKYNQKTLKYIYPETIYAWIYSHPNGHEDLYKFLTRHKKKRGRRKSKGACKSRIPCRISIHDRPKSATKEFGHWDGDLVTFKKNTQQILVLRERKTMFTFSCVLPGKHAKTTGNAAIDLLRGIPKVARKSITFDNGGEFADHKKIAETLGLDTYFCDPYCSWQKGGVENTTGRLRRDFPRKTDVKSMMKENFDETIENYNTTPRKKLKWKTPLQAFHKYLQRVALRS